MDQKDRLREQRTGACCSAVARAGELFWSEGKKMIGVFGGLGGRGWVGRLQLFPLGVNCQPQKNSPFMAHRGQKKSGLFGPLAAESRQ